MYKARIVFFGTRIWELTSRHLQMFLQHGANIVAFVEAPPEDVSTTVTKKDPYKNIVQTAERLDIPIYSPKDLEEPGLLAFLTKSQPEMIVVCGFQVYIPEAIRKLPSRGIVNFHSSLLPRHAGMHPGFFTIYYGDVRSGMVIHYMDEGIDTGDILYQSEVPVKSGDTIADLYDRIWDSSGPLIKRLLEDLEWDTLPRRPQDINEYFYNYELSLQDYELDFRLPAVILYGRVCMMPGKFYVKIGDTRYNIQKCSVVSQPLAGRKYVLRKPYEYKGKLIFLTPRDYLQIDSMEKDGKEVDPLSIAEDGFG
jgi:methionyl-tRNA formyltransferase